jgi:hypothetical protein
MVRAAEPTPEPQDYELVDSRFPERGDSCEELMIRETPAFAVMQARLEREVKWSSHRAIPLIRKKLAK